MSDCAPTELDSDDKPTGPALRTSALYAAAPPAGAASIDDGHEPCRRVVAGHASLTDEGVVELVLLLSQLGDARPQAL